MNTAIELKPKTDKFSALSAWLRDRNETPLEEIAKQYNNLDSIGFKQLVSEIYTRCVNAAIAYHSDKSGELSHGGAAYEHGVDLWVYIYFKTKFEVYHTQGENGLMCAEKLKENELYDHSLIN